MSLSDSSHEAAGVRRASAPLGGWRGRFRLVERARGKEPFRVEEQPAPLEVAEGAFRMSERAMRARIILRAWIWVLILAVPASAQTAASSLRVDFGQRDEQARSMSGLLHGFIATRTDSWPPDRMFLPLRPAQWRLNFNQHGPAMNGEVYARVRRSGARIQLLLSDAWGYEPPRTWGNKGWPFEDFALFESFVRDVARANKDKAVVWDVWNEPTLPQYWRGTRKQFFETYKRAYRILRAELGPDAVIGGPSLPAYDERFIRRFLDYCKENDCEVNFLSWHELDDNRIATIPQRIELARKLFLANPAYAKLKIREIQINEFVSERNQYAPGVILGYLYYLERGRADGACRSCWPDARRVSNCFNGSLGGIVDPETGRPRAAWWAHEAYADGAGSRVQSSSSDPFAVALASASSQSAPDEARVVVGRFGARFPFAYSVALTLDRVDSLPFVGRSGVARVRVERIPDFGEKVLERLPVLRDEDRPMAGGSLTIDLGDLRPGDALVVTISRATRLAHPASAQGSTRIFAQQP